MPIRLTKAVKVLIIACFAVFVVQQTADQFFGANLLGWLALTPSAVVNHLLIWQLFTYAFLHGEVMHLFLNMLMLAFIGSELEAAWGTRRFLAFYFTCSTVAALLYLVFQVFSSNPQGLHTPMLGASGAIYGLLVAYGLIFGERVMLFMMLFPMKAKHFVWVLATIEFMSTIYSRNALASVAHLGGMAAGFCFLWIRAMLIISKKRREEELRTGRKPKRRGGHHLKLVVDNQDDLPDDERPPTWH